MNIYIKTRVYANRIVEHVREEFGRDIDEELVCQEIMETLRDERMLDAIAGIVWHEQLGHKGGLPYAPMDILELAPHGFNPCPIEQFVNGHVDLREGIGECFSQTMLEALDEDNWAENQEFSGEELTVDLFCDDGRPMEDPSNRQWWVVGDDHSPSEDCKSRLGISNDRPAKKAKAMKN